MMMDFSDANLVIFPPIIHFCIVLASHLCISISVVHNSRAQFSSGICNLFKY